MAPQQKIVITGLGVVSPIGVGKAAFLAGLGNACSGVRRLPFFQDRRLPTPIGGAIANFDPKLYVRPRKSLKVMSRDIQFAFAAADEACADAALHDGAIDPERLGIVFGADLIPSELPDLTATYRDCMADGQFQFGRWGPSAMADIFPLWMLKYLPNMPACHIGIAQDARGPNNSLTLADVSSLTALAEAVRVIERGQADVMIVGGSGCRLHPAILFRNAPLHLGRSDEDPTAASRPFDAGRRGMVLGEGAAALIVESRQRAEARGAAILAEVLGYAVAFEPSRKGAGLQGKAIRAAITGALRKAGIAPADVGHVNAHGQSTIFDDRIEAQAIRDLLGDVPVTAPKSFFGNLGAGSGAVEMAVSVLALQDGLVPPTLNYEHPDPACPVNVICGGPMKTSKPIALVLNHTQFGQAAAVVLGAAE